MSLKNCENGHFYDDNVFSSCPTCAVKYDNSPQVDPPKKVKKITISRRSVEEDDNRTIAYHSEYTGNNYVTGWLICVEGAEKGRDYRLHFGFNRIGTSGTMDIRIAGDSKIAEKYHCAVVYDDKSNGFFICPGKGTITYLNDELLKKSHPLYKNDEIMIGESRFEFVPFCGGDKKWDQEN